MWYIDRFKVPNVSTTAIIQLIKSTREMLSNILKQEANFERKCSSKYVNVSWTSDCMSTL